VEEFIREPKEVEKRMRVAPPTLQREVAPATAAGKARATTNGMVNGESPMPTEERRPARKSTGTRTGSRPRSGVSRSGSGRPR